MPDPSSDMARSRRKPLPEGPYDLAVIGGGINGVAIARDAVLRGHTVCLLEKGDFGSGTSSCSSKMLHGGIRYLEQLQFGLVFEALRERSIQLRVAPHLAHPQEFLIPVYEDSRRKLPWIGLGVRLYDLLALGRRLGRSRTLSAAETLARAPGLRQTGLRGSGLYYDSVMDDARICLANLLDARAAAAVRQLQARSYTEVHTVRETSPTRLEVHDRILGRSFPILADRVVRAVGPWADLERTAGEELLLPSKGVHLVLPALPELGIPPSGLLLTHQRDGRVFFVIPWLGKTLVGTTETPFHGTPDDLEVQPEEVDYLLDELARVLPEAAFSRSDIVAVFAGVRPLARSRWRLGGLGRVSRKHRLVETRPGVFTLVGGKYTNYRAVARQVVDRVLPGRGSTTRTRPLDGGGHGNWEAYRLKAGPAALERWGEDLLERLFHRYGSRLVEVLALAESEPGLDDPLGVDAPELRAEVVHGVLREEVLYPEDFLCRRSDLRFRPGNGRAVYDTVEELIREYAAPLGRVPPDLEAHRERYFATLAHEDRLRGAVGVKE